jgi:hypothetical protein
MENLFFRLFRNELRVTTEHLFDGNDSYCTLDRNKRQGFGRRLSITP